MNEQGVEYRDVVGFPGYKVGSDGTVWSCWRTNGQKSDRYRQLTGSAGEDGYLRVTLGRHIRKWLHHIVLEAFVGPCPDDMVACHFPDINPANNRVANLRWDTQVGNMHDRELCGNTMRGDAHARAKLTSRMVEEFRVRASNGESAKHLADEVGVSHSVIYQAVTGQTWRESGGPLMVPMQPVRIDGITIEEWAKNLGFADSSNIYRNLKRGVSFSHFLAAHCPQCGGAGAGIKVCSSCHEAKSIGEFGRRTGNRDGRMNCCLVCAKKKCRFKFAKEGLCTP